MLRGWNFLSFWIYTMVFDSKALMVHGEGETPLTTLTPQKDRIPNDCISVTFLNDCATTAEEVQGQWRTRTRPRLTNQDGELG